MARIERVVTICDSCGTDDNGDGNGEVGTHKLEVDGASWRIDACHKCWTTTYRAALAPLTRNAYAPRVPTTRRRGKSRRLTSVG